MKKNPAVTEHELQWEIPISFIMRGHWSALAEVSSAF